MNAILDPCEIDSDDCDAWQTYEDAVSAQGAMYVSASGVNGMWGANVSFVNADSVGNKTYMDVINQQNHDFNNTLVAQDNQVALAKALLLDISNAASTAALASINANMSFQVAFAAALKTRMHSLDTALIGQVTALSPSNTLFSGVTVASLGSISWERSTWNFLWGVVSSLPIIGRIVQTPLFAQLTDYSVDTTSAAFRDGAIAGMIAQVILGPMLALTCLPSYIGLAGAVYEDLNLVQAVWSAGEAVIDISQTGHVTWSDALSITLAVIAVYGKFGKATGLLDSCFAEDTQIDVGVEKDGSAVKMDRAQSSDDDGGVKTLAKEKVRRFTKRVEEIVADVDFVAARNENDPTAPVVLRKVEKVFKSLTYHLLHVTILSSNGEIHTLQTTNPHRFEVPGEGWKQAQTLLPGQALQEKYGGISVILSTRFEAHREGVWVYNFKVAEHPTYFVSGQGSDAVPVLAHNQCGDEAAENTVGSGLIGDIRPASFVRQVSEGENIPDLVDELKQLTFQSRTPQLPVGLEHGIVSLEDGSRWIVSGGQEGIDFGGVEDLDRLIVHTHGAPTGPSPADYNYLLNNGQQSSYIVELGNPNIIHFNVNGTYSEISIGR